MRSYSLFGSICLLVLATCLLAGCGDDPAPVARRAFPTGDGTRDLPKGGIERDSMRAEGGSGGYPSGDPASDRRGSYIFANDVHAAPPRDQTYSLNMNNGPQLDEQSIADSPQIEPQRRDSIRRRRALKPGTAEHDGQARDAAGTSAVSPS